MKPFERNFPAWLNNIMLMCKRIMTYAETIPIWSLLKVRHGLHDIGLLFMPDRFPESGKKNAPECESLHKATTE